MSGLERKNGWTSAERAGRCAGDRDREAYDQARYLRDWLEERDASYVMAC
ncbi:hypothetical protein IU500_01045 [Nocardia terpenica]|nr:hypothetical protein [Nocardia terpenica]MBF6059838.1 hypothetical protein [Nocardia terpenica]MBF6102621.1 hypothetical protein [Nocardia terpenica]MBF6111188.1 hypothetical protein [Nocardia terpenica]MBF6117319.1 hypothetical protein [Nocardia terpenica]MBF6150840.1 hypothetical protein [Nocardia terpenica]